MRRVKMISALIILFILSIFVSVQAAPVPDTGQTQSYTDTFGEDSDYTINPHSYTKLDAQGNILPDNAVSWTMVKDNVTGLIWEAKTDDGSIHNKDNAYNWYEAQNVFVASLNAANFGGSSEWHLPMVKELSFHNQGYIVLYRDTYWIITRCCIIEFRSDNAFDKGVLMGKT